LTAEADTITLAGPPADRLLDRAAAVGQRVASQPRKLGWRHRLVFALAVTDAAGIVVALLVAQFVRFRTTALGAATPVSDVAYLSLGAAIAAVWLIALSATRSRMIRNIGTGTVEYQRVVNATLITFGTLAVVAFLLQVEIARGYLAVALPLGLVLLLGGRVAWRWILHRMRRVGRCTTGSIIDISNTSIMQNATGIASGSGAAGGGVNSHGNNQISGNTAAGTTPNPVGQQ